MSKANPNVPYKWEEDTIFEITGKEFGLIRNLVGAVLRGEEVPRVILAMETDKVVKRVFQDNIENGKIFEDVESQIVSAARPLVGANGMPLQQ